MISCFFVKYISETLALYVFFFSLQEANSAESNGSEQTSSQEEEEEAEN